MVHLLAQDVVQLVGGDLHGHYGEPGLAVLLLFCSKVHLLGDTGVQLQFLGVECHSGHLQSYLHLESSAVGQLVGGGLQVQDVGHGQGMVYLSDVQLAQSLAVGGHIALLKAHLLLGQLLGGHLQGLGEEVQLLYWSQDYLLGGIVVQLGQQF